MGEPTPHSLREIWHLLQTKMGEGWGYLDSHPLSVPPGGNYICRDISAPEEVVSHAARAGTVHAAGASQLPTGDRTSGMQDEWQFLSGISQLV